MAETTSATITGFTIKYNGTTISSPPSTCPSSSSAVSITASGSGTITLSFSLIVDTEYDNNIYSTFSGTVSIYWEHCNSAVTVYTSGASASTSVSVEDANGYSYTLDSQYWSATWHNDNTTATAGTFKRLGYIDISASNLMNTIQWDFTITIPVDGTLWDASTDPEKDGILFYVVASGQVNP